MSVFSKTNKNESFVFDYLKGLIIASLCSLLFIIAFAFFIKWFDIADSYLNLITLGVKAVSVIIGAIFAVKGTEKGLLKGAIFGLVYVIVAFLIFSLLAGSFSLKIGFLLDLAFASLLGGIVGIIKVNRK
ncbi:MAG: TIGR04086 family membrane protein [Clostridia bacterium]|nr:TIGR04086 family membrane protein [Clostridia bacterium]